MITHLAEIGAWFGVSNFHVIPQEESGKVFRGQLHIFDSFLSVGSEIKSSFVFTQVMIEYQHMAYADFGCFIQMVHR